MAFSMLAALDSESSRVISFTGYHMPSKDDRRNLPVVPHETGTTFERITHVYSYPRIQQSEIGSDTFHQLNIKLPNLERFSFKVTQLHLAPGATTGRYLDA